MLGPLTRGRSPLKPAWITRLLAHHAGKISSKKVWKASKNVTFA
jgi:hypothetical protein